jgi:ABC-type transporter Mla maintaining outer membrane lipid asymmetry ATPase subunit MlaF
MVAVARTLSGDTRLLLLDEPFEGLALALSDRTVALERGVVTHIGPSRALSKDLDLRRKVLWL